MKDIFTGLLPYNFFNLFQGDTRRLMSQYLFVLYDQVKHDLDFRVSRNKAIEVLCDYIELLDRDIQSTPRDKAMEFIRRLQELSWVSVELDAQYNQTIVFYDYTIQFINYISDLEETEILEYSGYIYAIDKFLKEVKASDAMESLDNAYQNTVSLSKELKLLNTNIKNYHQRLFETHIKDDVNELMRLLTSEYQMKVLDKAYYNLITKDNPDRYRLSILMSIDNIKSDDEILHAASVKAADRKDMGFNEAYAMYYDRLDEIYNYFDRISEIINEINHKNEKLIGTALNRVDFILNSSGDIAGHLVKLIQTLKNVDDDFELPVKIHDIFTMDDRSLYTPREKTKMDVSTITDYAVEAFEMEAEVTSLLKPSMYSRVHVEQMVLDHLDHQKEVSIRDVVNEDITLAILAYIYGYAYGSKYEVVEDKTEVFYNGVTFKNYNLRRKQR